MPRGRAKTADGSNDWRQGRSDGGLTPPLPSGTLRSAVSARCRGAAPRRQTAATT